jgi:hypothetical protein
MDPRSQGELVEQLSDILNNVESARPSAELAETIRRHYAPPTIARRYYELLSGVPSMAATGSL